VVHGLDGLDEITTTTETVALEIRAGAIAHRTLAPEDFGVRRADPAELKGDDAEANAQIARAVLDGEAGPRRDIVLVNSSAALVASGMANDFRQGMSIAAESIDSGAAKRKLTELVRYTTSCHTTA
jgi:anthranilate phosphoribosyltransferase